jgi:hypothetical protein
MTVTPRSRSSSGSLSPASSSGTSIADERRC